jgi:hypothetical protein
MRMYEAPEKPLLVVSDAQAQGMVALVPSTFEEKLSAWMMKSVWASTVTPASLPASVAIASLSAASPLRASRGTLPGVKLHPAIIEMHSAGRTCRLYAWLEPLLAVSQSAALPTVLF